MFVGHTIPCFLMDLRPLVELAGRLSGSVGVDYKWQVTGDSWQVTSDRWQVTGHGSQVTGGKWHVTHDFWFIFLDFGFSIVATICIAHTSRDSVFPICVIFLFNSRCNFIIFMCLPKNLFEESIFGFKKPCLDLA